MLTEKVIVRNPSGLHARPAAKLVTEAKKYHSKVTIFSGSKKIDGKSILSILTGGITRGTEIELQFEGDDEREAKDAITSLIRSGLGEDIA